MNSNFSPIQRGESEPKILQEDAQDVENTYCIIGKNAKELQCRKVNKKGHYVAMCRKKV